MFKKSLILCSILFFSSRVMAETAPDCSPDKDKKLVSNLFTSLKETKYKSYAYDLIQKNSSYKITLLSSEKVSTSEKERLMTRRAKQFNFNEKDIVESGLEAAYLKEIIFRQYYKIEFHGHQTIIAEYYSIPHYCAVDLESIYFLSDEIEGYTSSFLDNMNTPY